MADRSPTHPHFGKEVRIEQHGREVRLIFVARTTSQAIDFAEELLRQLDDGVVNLALTGKPTSIEET